MYCIKCGSQLKDGLRYCTRCGTKADNLVGQTVKKVETFSKKEKHKNQRAHKKRSHRFFLISLLMIVAVTALVCIAICILMLYRIREDTQNKDNNVIVTTTTPYTDETEPSHAFYQEIADEDIVIEGDVQFVDSQLLLTATEGTTYSEIEELVKEEEGSIVGFLPFTSDYQIEFTDGKTFDELYGVIEKWKSESRIEEVSLHYVESLGEQSVDYTGDPWIDEANPGTSGSVWDENNPDGNNWWAETIRMPSVWNMDLELETVKVGVYDTMFDITNEDLDEEVFVKIWNNPEDDEGNCKVSTLYEEALQELERANKSGEKAQIEEANRDVINAFHGTHVSGIIGAQAENGFGIAGVSQNAKLYGYSYNRGTIYETKYALSLMLSEGVKIINMSNCFESIQTGAEDGDKQYVELLELYSKSMENFLLKYLNSGYEFLIVKAAGNYGRDRDAKYDYLGAITNTVVAKHILIVGAAERSGSYYEICDFSVTGERVDVYAPGRNVLSDLPTNVTGMGSGTSMATPIVSGIAALVWGVNPNLSAEQVADIIEDASIIPYSIHEYDLPDYNNKNEDDYPIVNAYFSVELAHGTEETGEEASLNKGLIYGIAYIIDDHGKIKILDNISVSVYSLDGTLICSEKTDGLGTYTYLLEPGTYKIVAKGDGYEQNEMEVTISANEVLLTEHEMTDILVVVLDAEKMNEDAHKLYEEVLDQYKVLLGEPEKIDISNKEEFPDIYINTMYVYSMDNFGVKVYYTYYDINGDGVDELLISFDGNGTDGIYNYNNVNLLMPLETGTYRSHIRIFEDGTVLLASSGGAASGAYTYYKFDEGQIKLQTEYSYDYMSENKAYENGVELDMTENEFYSFLAEKNQSHKEVELDWTKLGETAEVVSEQTLDEIVGMEATYSCIYDYDMDGETEELAIYQYNDKWGQLHNCKIWYKDDEAEQLFIWEDNSGNSFCGVSEPLIYYDNTGKPYIIVNTYRRVAASYRHCMIFGMNENKQFCIIFDQQGEAKSVEANIIHLELETMEIVEGANHYSYEKKDTYIENGELKYLELEVDTSTALIHQQHSYMIFEEDDITTWEDAQNYCKQLGGHLAIISSKEENDTLFQYMISSGYNSAYFGYTDEVEEGVWVWVNDEVSSYTNWHTNEPNSENTKEDYAMFYYKYSDGTWNDGDFGNRTVGSGKAFICEWDYEIEVSASSDYLLPTSNVEYLTESDLQGLTTEELRLARNEIYARHGRMFKSEDLINYFTEKSWYEPVYEPEQFDQISMELFNEYERANLELLLQVEESRKQQ